MSKIKMIIPRQNSPIGAIRKFCIECSGGGRKDISECNIYRCPLFPYRFGIMPDTYAANNNNVEIINKEGKVIENEKRRSGKKKSS